MTSDTTTPSFGPAPTGAITWDEKGPTILGGEGAFLRRDVDGIGGHRITTVFFRIDGRGDFSHPEGTAYRVDVNDFVMWVAIDNGRAFPTIEDAKRYAEAYLALCSKQNTRSPEGTIALREQFPTT